MNITLDKNDEIVMKLLHYFITEQGYNPVILHGAKDEIWLENTDGEYQIIRIVTNYIHNDEQLEYDIFKTKQIMKSIKRKTLSFKMDTLSIFINLGENVHLKDDISHIDCIYLTEINDIDKYDFVLEKYPTIKKLDKVSEQGLELFMKLTEEINAKNQEDAMRAEDVFSKKRPIVTYALILSNIIMYILPALLSSNIFSLDLDVLKEFGALLNYNSLNNNPVELYRLITSMFLHSGIIHLTFNLYALYVLGPQIESFFGKAKYLFIYLVSGIIGGLLSMIFLPDNVIGIGASGAIFGLIGAFILFGYYYRVYLGSVIKSQIIPLLILNLLLGLFAANISLSAHIGGLVGGILAAKIVGIKYKTDKSDTINGIIMISILTLFLLYIGGIIL